MSRKSAHKTRKSSGSISIGEITKGLGCSRSEAIKGLAHLEELNLLELDGTSRKGGGKWKVTSLGMATVAIIKSEREGTPGPSPKWMSLAFSRPQ